MKKLIFILVLLLFIGSNVATYLVTKANIKPEKVIVTQEKEIIKYKYMVKEAEVKEQARYIVRIPGTKIGITKDFTAGTVFGYVVKALAVL